MQIDREKLLKWLRFMAKAMGNSGLHAKESSYINVIENVESGTFDIKEDTDHADRG